MLEGGELRAWEGSIGNYPPNERLIDSQRFGYLREFNDKIYLVELGPEKCAISNSCQRFSHRPLTFNHEPYARTWYGANDLKVDSDIAVGFISKSRAKELDVLKY